MNHFTPLTATLGGLMVGLAASLLFLANGRILGVSGIVGEIPRTTGEDRSWRLAFLGGLLSGGVALLAFDRSLLALASEQSVGVAVASGILVGVGTRLGNGCTSGHGLCGVARLSTRSLVATMVFMAVAALTVAVTHHVLHMGGAS